MNKIAFSVDFEDWYQGINLPFDTWHKYEKRLHIGHELLLTLLQKHKTKATYFILGKNIEEHPNLIKEIINEGHEIACHTYTHPFLFKINEEQFREEIKQCKEAIRPFNTHYNGFRAPYFSIDERSFWALDILIEEGFIYDSSIFPGDAKRTGIPGFNPNIQEVKHGLTEFPISTFKVFKFDFGVGGAYFRILPYPLFRNYLRKAATEKPCMFYIHPWELDPKHPYIKGIEKRIRFTHYFNLKNTEEKLRRLLDDFSFTTVEHILSNKNK